ncbi:transposase InsO family protein [Bradyrhizobium sp. USDA 336]
MRNKTPKRRVKAKLRDDRKPATRSNETWAMDFVHDQLASGHKLRVLTIVDIFSRFSPVLQPQFSFRSSDVVAILESACKEVGFPATIRVDQGSEFVSRGRRQPELNYVDLQAWLAEVLARLPDRPVNRVADLLP